MIAKLLQQTNESDVPVLAKRKTPVMKEIEAERMDAINKKKARLSRKKEREGGWVKNPSMQIKQHPSSQDYERNLRKLATRGVVALFNAISKSKKDLDNSENNVSEKNNTSKDTVHVTQSAFVSAIAKRIF